MAKAKKLPSGRWRVQVYNGKDENGKNIMKSFTADTKVEAELLAKQYEKDRTECITKPQETTLRSVVEKYISLSETLSPTTLQAYNKVLKYSFGSIIDVNVSDLTTATVQAAINIEAKRKAEKTGKQISPKTVKNEWGLIAAALKQICDKSFNIRLPKVQKNPSVLPDPQVVAGLIKGSPVELPCLLAMWMGLRMSEVLGLMCSSVQNGYLTISRVAVKIGSEVIIKEDAKTQSSKRILRVPGYIMRMIECTESYKSYIRTRKDQRLIDQTCDAIYYRFTKIMQGNGIDLSFHDLRHIYASVSLNILNIPSKIVQRSGGWATASVMENIYSQAFDSASMQADEKRDEYFGKLFES